MKAAHRISGRELRSGAKADGQRQHNGHRERESLRRLSLVHGHVTSNIFSYVTLRRFGTRDCFGYKQKKNRYISDNLETALNGLWIQYAHVYAGEQRAQLAGQIAPDARDWPITIVHAPTVRANAMISCATSAERRTVISASCAEEIS
jgi:hypothetical protein